MLGISLPSVVVVAALVLTHLGGPSRLVAQSFSVTTGNLPPHADFTPRADVEVQRGEDYWERGFDRYTDLLALGYVMLAELEFSTDEPKATNPKDTSAVIRRVETEMRDWAKAKGGDRLFLYSQYTPKIDQCGEPTPGRDALGRTADVVHCQYAKAVLLMRAEVWRREPEMAKGILERVETEADRDAWAKKADSLVPPLVARSDTTGLLQAMKDSKGVVGEHHVLSAAFKGRREDVVRWAARQWRDPPTWAAVVVAGQYGRADIVEAHFARTPETDMRYMAGAALFAAVKGTRCCGDREGDTLTAEARGRLAVIRLALSRGANVADFQDRSELLSHPVITASFDGFVEAVELLLAAGADPNTTLEPVVSSKTWPETVLGVVFMQQDNGPHRARLVRLLVERGADPKFKTWRGLSAQEYLRLVERKNRKAKGPPQWYSDPAIHKLLGME